MRERGGAGARATELGSLGVGAREREQPSSGAQEWERGSERDFEQPSRNSKRKSQHTIAQKVNTHKTFVLGKILRERGSARNRAKEREREEPS